MIKLFSILLKTIEEPPSLKSFAALPFSFSIPWKLKVKTSRCLYQDITYSLSIILLMELKIKTILSINIPIKLEIAHIY